ncbi:MAG: hypothetical protein K0Q55_3664, partial [Verrucomicrobia bacterium]|nr:hypothetical protein [Verrucomicrobiota bacterium]
MLVAVVPNAEAGKARISKVLPHLLDEKGRHTLSPSLYERDAYQSQLRKNPDRCTAVRFDIRWAGINLKRDSLKLRMEIRVSGEPNHIVLEEAIKPLGVSGSWSELTLKGEEFKKAGKIIAWRATLIEADKEVAELKSFLW